jgi:hypothetical protein
LQCCVAGVPTAASISSVASVPDDVVAHNIPVASSFAVDSAVADVFMPLALLGLQQFSWFLLFPSSLLVRLFLLLLMSLESLLWLESLLLLPSLLLFTLCLLPVFPTFLDPEYC